MDLLGNPSTFSADGTEKLVVGEDGLEGGSLVVSISSCGRWWNRPEKHFSGVDGDEWRGVRRVAL